MAEIHGIGGTAFWNTVEIDQVIRWSIISNCEIAEITSMKDEWTKPVAGLNGWSATVETFMNTTGFNPDATTFLLAGVAYPLALVLNTVSVLAFYLGNALLEDVSCSVDVNTVEKVIYKFRGNGLLGFSSRPV